MNRRRPPLAPGRNALVLLAACAAPPAHPASAQPAPPAPPTHPAAAGTAAPAPPPSPPAAPAQPPPFRLFRYDEDYSYLADPALRTHPLDAIKFIPLNDDATIVLSLGGEARSRYEYSSAPSFGLRAPGHDDFFLQRFLLHSDLHLGDRQGLNGRAFVQLLSGLVAGEEFPKTGTQDNVLDLQQAFGEISLGDTRTAPSDPDAASFRLRAGRQEMGFGSFRLVTSREPTNARLSFDGARGTLRVHRATIDAFLVRPVDPKIGIFNDGEDDSTTFWGLYSAFPLPGERAPTLDVYYLGLQRDRTRYASGIGDELRHSLGTRISGRARAWDHDTEALFQFGSFDRPAQSEDILAWTVASNTGYTFEDVAWKPRAGLKLNVASGDADPDDGTLGTFNPLFPRNNYFSDANLLAPYNFFDIHPTLTLRPTASTSITAGWDAFFRYSTDDAVFSPSGIVIPATASDSRYVGSTLTLVAEWAINRHLTLTTSYAHFFRGDVVEDAGGENVDFFGIWFTARF